MTAVSADGETALETCTKAVRETPELFEIVGAPRAACRLPGLTNHVFRLQSERGDFVLRLPRVENAGQIDRAAECFNLQVASGLGVGVPPLWCDPVNGLLLLPAVTSHGRPKPADLGHLLGKLHGSSAAFAFERELSSYLEACAAALGEMLLLPRDVRRLYAQARELLAGLPDAPLVPCHFDPAPANILMTEGGARLIDFEYAAMAPAAWDLAYCLLEHDLDGAAQAELLAAYGRYTTCPERRELEVYKVVCDTVSMLWALRQAQVGNDADNFTDLATGWQQRGLLRSAALLSAPQG